MILIKVFRCFNRRKVRYLVAGGVAATLYGNPRFTKDLDIFVDCEERNLKMLIQAFKSLGFIPRAPVKAEDFIFRDNRERWKREKGMLAFTFINRKNPFENIDILFDSPIPFAKAYQRRKNFKVEHVVIPVISEQDLITMKKKAGRPQDLEDIEILKAVARAKRESTG